MTEPPRTAPAAAPVPPPAELDRSVVHGLAWTFTARWLTQGIKWASTLLVARLLTRADYGVMSMATVYVGLITMFSEFGLGSAVIQHRELRRDQIAQISGISLLIGVGLCALSIAIAPLLAGVYREPAVAWIVMALAVTFVLRGAQVVPRALLNRALQFRRLAVLDSAEAVLQALATLALAAAGFGYWALAGGALSAAVAGTLLFLIWHGHPVALPRRGSGVGRAVQFGSSVAVGRLAWYAYSNADFVIVGLLLGADALGAYTIGWTLANIPVERVSALVNRVMHAVFAAVQDDAAALRRYVLRLTEGLALLTLPAAAGLSLVADDFVLVVLGEQWRPAIQPLQLLCFYGGFRAVTALLPQALIGMRQAATNMRISILAAVVMPVAFVIGTRWGTVGVAVAWLVAFPVVVLPFYLVVLTRRLGLRPWDYARALWPAVSGVALMAIAVLVVRSAMAAAGHLPRLAATVATGAAIYAAVIMLLHRPRVQAMLATIRAAR